MSKMKSNNLSISHPHLTDEWHHKKNGDLRPEDVTPGSGKKVWWVCSNGHEWKTYVYSRAGKSASGCPTCAQESKKGRHAIYEESLAYLYPEIAAQWDYERNGQRGPDTYKPGSNQRAYWICSEGHRWDTVIGTRLKSNCPYCAGQKVCKETSFGSKFPEIVKEWHLEKNNGKTPFDVMPNTHQKAWFKCENNHEWEAFIFNRAKGKGCPYCSGHKATNETSLLAVNPELCKEWDYEKNKGKDPSTLKPYSNEKVWWKCSKGHEWESVISGRSDGRGCPICSSNSQTSFPEQAIFYYIKKMFPDTENRKKLPFLENNMEADIYIDSLKLAIEYDGYYHMKELERDMKKNDLMKENGIQLIRVRQVVGERKLPDIEGEDIFIIEHDYNHKNGLDYCLQELFTYLCNKYQLDYPNFEINANKKRGEILEQMNENERNFEALFPELVEEWDFERNGKLLPNQVAPFTHLSVWWKCRKNPKHVWEAKISNRANGRTCPFCLNRKINETNSLETLEPELAKQWHPTKNGELMPSQVAPNYSKKIWWICENGHEWERSPNGRMSNKTFDCPVCRKEKVKSDK